MTATDPAREAFLAERRKGIGGSDVAPLLGIEPRKTPYQLWREKTGHDDGDAGKPSAARRGRFLEAAILERYRQTVQLDSIETGVPHEADGGWRRGNQDARAIGVDGVRRTVEAKSVNINVFRLDWGRPWTDEVPDRALCQGLWYANLDGADVVDFAVLVIPDDPDEVLGLTADEVAAVSDFHIFQAPRNERVEEFLVERARGFWFDHVETGVPPPLANSDDLDLLFPSHIEGAHKPVEPILELINEYAAVGATEKAAKKRREYLRERILLYAEGSEYLAAPNGDPWLQMKTETRSAHFVSESKARVLRLTKWWNRAHPKTATNPNQTEN